MFAKQPGFREQVVAAAKEAADQYHIAYYEPFGEQLPERAEDVLLVFRNDSNRWGALVIDEDDEERHVSIGEFIGERWRASYSVSPFGEQEWKSFLAVMKHLRAFMEKKHDAVPALVFQDDPYVFSTDRVLYAVTTCKIHRGDPGIFMRRRTVGIFQSFESVHAVLQENDADIYEDGYYPQAVVEAVALGRFHAVSKVRAWYGWDDDFDGYRHIEEPEGFSTAYPLGSIDSLEEQAVFNGRKTSPVPAVFYSLDPEPVFDAHIGLRVPEGEVVLAVTACEISQGEYPLFHRVQTIGLLTQMKQVHLAIQKNAGDIYEGGRFPYVFVEGVHTNSLYGVSHNRIWYRWNDSQNRYRPVEEPPGFERIVALGGIG